MPTAEPFKALGQGNGFPFCPEVLDMSDPFFSSLDWVTLGGTRKGSTPTRAEKNKSLVNAMRMFWNFYAINGSATAQSTGGSVSTVIEATVPKSRVCRTALSNDNSDDGASMSFFLNMVDMRDSGGDFIGYGATGLFILDEEFGGVDAFGQIRAQGDFSSATLFFGSILSGGSFTGGSEAFGLVTVGGIPFIGNATGRDEGGGSSASLDPFQATSTDFNGDTASASLNGLDFYTY